MEGATEPEALEHRTYYKMGLFVYDNAKVVLILTLILCGSLASLMTLEPRYAEGYGEGDLESVHGWDAARIGFTTEMKVTVSHSTFCSITPVQVMRMNQCKMQ